MKTFGRFLGKVGSRIKTIRLQAGLTQEKVSELIGIPYRRYQSIEAGKSKSHFEKYISNCTIFWT